MHPLPDPHAAAGTQAHERYRPLNKLTSPEGERQPLPGLPAARRGHFKLESGHHGDLWLDLDLFLHPGRLRPFVVELAARLHPHSIEAVCGPLTGGAFLAQVLASELEVDFYYTKPSEPRMAASLYPVEYRLPSAIRAGIRGKKVAVVDDVINAGSAVRGTLADLQACGAHLAAIGALLVLGSAASSLAATCGVPLVSLAALPVGLWIPAECPLCAEGTPLENPTTP